MSIKEINWSPTQRQLRQFALASLLIAGAIILWLIWDGVWNYGLLVLSACAGYFLYGCIYPTRILPFYRLLLVCSVPIGWVITFLLLVIIYYGMLTPLGIIFRWMGRDTLQLQYDPEATSYWQPRTPVTNPKRYLQQF